MNRHGLMAFLLVAACAETASAQSKASRAPRSVASKPAETKSVAEKPAVEKPEPPAPSGPPTPELLAAISRRGRALFEHDSIAWLGGDAMAALSFPDDSVRRLLTRRTQQGWEVATGRLTADEHAFLIAQLSVPGMQEGRWATSEFEPPQSDSGYYAEAGRAIETSLTMFRPAAPRPYIAMAIPADDAPGWLVYFYPAPLRDGGVWPRGGDMRFRVSADGRVITETRRLHESITEYSVTTARPASSLPEKESLVSGDTPEDTDVFHVLQRRPLLPEIMIAGRFRYRIDVDGSIRLLP